MIDDDVVEGALNERQQAFVEEYLIDLNATRAAIRAGYSPTSARTVGPRLLSDDVVAAALQRALSERSKRTGITAERVLQELAHVAFSDITQAVELMGGGVSIKVNADSPESIRRAVESISEKPSEHGVARSVKMHPKLAALKMLADHLGLSTDQLKIELSGPGGAPIQTDAKLTIATPDGVAQIKRNILFGVKGAS